MMFWKKSREEARSKSPISDLEMPLPPAGATVHEKLLDTALSVVPWLGCSVVATIIALGVVLDRLLPDGPLWWLPIVTVVPITYTLTFWKFRRVKEEMVRLRLGLRGERYVAARLEELRPLGYLVTHDLPAAVKEEDTHFNIDHVIVGPGGVFAVETKTWSKPAGENPKLLLRGDALVRSDRPLHPEQAKAPEQARNAGFRVAKILKAATGRDFPVAAILAVPGWWTQESGNTQKLMLLNPKRLEAALKARPELLEKREILLVHAQLQAHGRAAMAT